MFVSVVKAKVKDELSNGYLPAQMQGTPVHLSLIRSGCDGSDKLTQGIGKLQISGLLSHRSDDVIIFLLFLVRLDIVQTTRGL